MGEDFLRRKNESFVRRRDAHFRRLVEPDLFSESDAHQHIEVVGRIVHGTQLSAGDELWAPDVPTSDPVPFFRGDRVALVCDGPAAEHLRDEAAGARGGIIAKVAELAPVDHLAVITTVLLRRSKPS
jgi:hypothetical protein